VCGRKVVPGQKSVRRRRLIDGESDYRRIGWGREWRNLWCMAVREANGKRMENVGIGKARGNVASVASTVVTLPTGW